MPSSVENDAAISPLAGKPAPKTMLADLGRLEREYHQRRPDLDDRNQRVSFGTSGHRGSPFDGSFTEGHILAITQAICDYRKAHGIDGPLYMGKDTHAVSGPARCTALEVLACWPRPVLSFVRLELAFASQRDLAQPPRSRRGRSDGGRDFGAPCAVQGSDRRGERADRRRAAVRRGSHAPAS